MGDENPIRTLGDYSKPSHEGYKNTIELPIRINVVPLRSDTIQLAPIVQLENITIFQNVMHVNLYDIMTSNDDHLTANVGGNVVGNAGGDAEGNVRGNVAGNVAPEFRPRSSDNKKSVRVSAFYLRRKRNLLDLSSCAGSELGSELTFLAGSELCSELTFLAGSELDLASYRSKNRVNILKSIDEGPFQMGTLRETLTEGTKGALHLGLERPRVYSDLTSEEKDRYNADIRAINILLQGLPKDIYSLINHYTDAKDIWDNVKMLLEGSELTKEDPESQLMQLNLMFVNNMLPEWGRFVTAVKLNRGLRDSNYDQLYAYLKQHENQATIQDGKVVIQNVQGRQNRGHGNNARGACVAGYGGAQNRVGYANPGQARQIKCYNCNGIDEEQLLFITSGQDNVVDDDVDEQPIQDLALNVDNVFQADDYDAFDSNVDEAPTTQTMFMANLSSADPVYDEAEEVTSLKKDFKQKENQYLEEFLDMKALKEKVEDKLFKQDQSLQTVHMLCKPKPYCDEQRKAAIGYKSPLCLTHAKQVQPTLYNGHEIIKTDYVPAIVHNS
nr:hypothetical protein [Tanacetum cinerariifolium]